MLFRTEGQNLLTWYILHGW